LLVSLLADAVERILVIARFEADTSEIDGVARIESSQLRLGDSADVKGTLADDYGLTAQLANAR
jgi:hypothetical protein